jgi:hypothetical protein
MRFFSPMVAAGYRRKLNQEAADKAKSQPEFDPVFTHYTA